MINWTLFTMFVMHNNIFFPCTVWFLKLVLDVVWLAFLVFHIAIANLSPCPQYFMGWSCFAVLLSVTLLFLDTCPGLLSPSVPPSVRCSETCYAFIFLGCPWKSAGNSHGFFSVLVFLFLNPALLPGLLFWLKLSRSSQNASWERI